MKKGNQKLNNKPEPTRQAEPHGGCEKTPQRQESKKIYQKMSKKVQKKIM